MRLVSLFSGGGGMDMGFQKAGFEIIWANEFDSKIWASYQANYPEVELDKRSIVNIPSQEIPDSDGIIGGPSCQSWSAGGANRGFDDSRGQVFLEYLRIIRDKQPKFFVIENVEGLLRRTHRESLEGILATLSNLGYRVDYKLLNANDYQVAQDRKRVIFVGRRLDGRLAEQLSDFPWPAAIEPKLVLRDAIGDLVGLAQPYVTGTAVTDNHYLNSDWSSQFMSRNRIRDWDAPSFTIVSSGRHCPIHPSAPAMERIDSDHFKFAEGKEAEYRRFTLRECARIQSFPDTYQLVINNVNDGYKILGNAVPVNLVYHVALAVRKCLEE